jgi:hypothetical protein
MKDEPCPTCQNPIGASIKSLRDERDRLLPFVTQHRSKRDEHIKRENDFKEQAEQLAAKDEQLQQRDQQLTRNEAALDELLKEARRPEENFNELRRQNQELLERIESAAVEHQEAIDKLIASLESQRKKTISERDKRKEAQQSEAELGEKLESLTSVLKKLTREYDLLESRYDRQSDLLETAREEATSLKRENRDHLTQMEMLEKDATSLRRANEQLTSNNQQLAKRVSDLKATAVKKAEKPQVSRASFPCGPLDLDLVQAFSQEASELFAPPKEIVSLGSGPFPEDDFDDYLKSLGITPYVDGYSWIIVGRDGWTEEQLNELIDNAELDEVRVFSQELFMAGILTTHDPFSLPLEILMRFSEGHPALEYLIEAGFEWPVIINEEDYGEPVYLRGSYERVEESPLYRMGYQVGVTNGLSKPRRKSLLKSAYEGAIPDVEDDDYMEEWGRPRQSKRLWRIAHHIAWLIRSRKSISSMRYAVTDWKDDLAWLREEFYTKRMRFNWPHG